MTARRDEAIERLLHTSLSSGPDASGDDCLDAETLAAYTGGAVTGAARAGLETHIADCNRCQTAVATLVNFETALGDSPEEAARNAPWWRVPLRQWAIPAAVGVAAGVLWLAIPDLTRRATQPVPDAVGTPAESQSAATRERTQPAAPLAAPSDAAQSGVALPDAALPDTATGGAPPAAAVRESAEERSAQMAARQAPAAAPSEGRAEAAAPSAGRAEAAMVEANEAVGEPLSQTAPTAAESAAKADTAARADQRTSGLDIVSPDPRRRWRIAGATVSISTDGGASWSAQQTGTTTELLAGSAPSADVCWLVGRGGLVLRTTTAGRQWQRTAPPAPGDLTAVIASSPLDAVVQAADGRRFRTADGGATWLALP